MMCEMSRAPLKRTTPEYSKHFSTYLEAVDSLLGENPFEFDEEQHWIISDVEASIEIFAVYRRFCSTDGGRLAQAPKRTEVGDVICILYGGSVPYVIGPCGDDCYTFIGECYVNGLMDGEAMHLEELGTRAIALR